MCQITNYIDDMFRYIVVIILGFILYQVMVIAWNIKDIPSTEDVQKIVVETMRDEFALQEFKWNVFTDF